MLVQHTEAATASLRTAAMVGALAALITMGQYTANFVFTRFSILEGLTPSDLVALRYGVAGALLLPWVASRGLRSLGSVGWMRGLVLTCSGTFSRSPWVSGGEHSTTAMND